MNYKKFLLLGLFIPFSLLFLSSQVLAADDAYEENDSRGAAKLISTGTTTSLNVKYGDDDWYYLSVTWNHTLTVELDYDNATGIIYLGIYDSTGYRVAYDYASTTEHKEVSYYTLVTANYYIKVNSYESTENSYSLTITSTEGVLGGDKYEYNNDFAHASFITVGMYYRVNGYYLNCSDNDWYYLNVNSGDTLIVTIHFNYDLGDMGLSLYNSTEDILDESSGNTDAEMCYYSVTTTGNYYILIDPVYYFGSNDYEMNVTIKSSTSIPPRSITFYAPTPGIVWDKGTTKAITWTSAGLIGNVSIMYADYAYAVSGTITTNTSNDWYFEWTVPSGITAAADYYITIRDIDYGWGKSSATFTVGPLGGTDDDDDDTKGDDDDNDSGSGSKSITVPSYSSVILLGVTLFTTIGLIYYYSRRKNQI